MSKSYTNPKITNVFPAITGSRGGVIPVLETPDGGMVNAQAGSDGALLVDTGGMPRVHTEIIPDDDYDVSGVADWGIMVTGEGTLYYTTVGDPAVTVEYPVDGHTLIPGQFARIMAATDGGLIVVGLAR